MPMTLERPILATGLDHVYTGATWEEAPTRSPLDPQRFVLKYFKGPS